MRDDARQAGFTLLEVIIALAIAGLALAALFSGAATGLRSSHVSGDTMSAVSLAQSHLAALGRTGPLVPGVRSGSDGGGFEWRMRIAPLLTIPLPPSGNGADVTGRPSRLVLFTVAVAVSWSMDGGMRHVELESQRIGQMATSGP